MSKSVVGQVECQIKLRNAILTELFHQYSQVEPFTDDIFYIRDSEGVGLFSVAQNRFLVEPTYQAIEKISAHCYKIWSGNVFGVYSTQKQGFIIPQQYDRIGPIGSGGIYLVYQSVELGTQNFRTFFSVEDDLVIVETGFVVDLLFTKDIYRVRGDDTTKCGIFSVKERRLIVPIEFNNVEERFTDSLYRVTLIHRQGIYNTQTQEISWKEAK